MKKTCEWTVTFYYDYDPYKIAKMARGLMEEDFGYSYEEALEAIINDEITCEDDYLYYNFNEEAMKKVIEGIKKECPYQKQLTLF